MSNLDSGLRAWIHNNLDRGCTAESMVEAMVVAGHARAFAWQAVPTVIAERRQSIAGNDTSASALGTRHRVPEPLPLATEAFVETSDRRVRVVSSINLPRAIVFADVLSHEECDELIRLSSVKLRRSRIVDPATGAEAEHDERTSHGTYFVLNENPLVQTIDRRLSELMRWPVENGEGLQILHYTVGGEYKPHFDYFNPADPGSAAHIAKGGNRVGTMVLYLSDVEAGGATVFTDAGIAVSPVKGNALFFSYDTPTPASLTLHGGAAVERGEKWIATKWVRERAYTDPDATDEPR